MLKQLLESTLMVKLLRFKSIIEVEDTTPPRARIIDPVGAQVLDVTVASGYMKLENVDWWYGLY